MEAAEPDGQPPDQVVAADGPTVIAEGMAATIALCLGVPGMDDQVTPACGLAEPNAMSSCPSEVVAAYSSGSRV